MQHWVYGWYERGRWVPAKCPNVQGASKKTGIMEFCIFCIIKGCYTIKIPVSNTYMIKSIQLAIIQAFTALWKLNIELMVVILNPHQRTKRKVNICHVCIKSIFKSCLASDPYHQLVFQKAIIVWRSKTVT